MRHYIAATLLVECVALFIAAVILLRKAKKERLVRKFLCKYSRRYRLHQICMAVGIMPYDWQRKFALGETDVLDVPPGRATGKTMAVMLRLLMAEPDLPGAHPAARVYFAFDPDWRPHDTWCARWYYAEYRRLWKRCCDAEIYPFYINHFQGRMP